MISSMNARGSSPLQTGNAAARERTDIARNPASGPQKAYQDVRNDLSGQRTAVAEPRTIEGDVLLARRVEARKAAEDVRLEVFRADDLPLRTAHALSTFAGVAGMRDNNDSELAGIDIHI